jgi:hypothetical protein
MARDNAHTEALYVRLPAGKRAEIDANLLLGETRPDMVRVAIDLLISIRRDELLKTRKPPQ